MSGYCHLNEGKGDETRFGINIFGKDISLFQNPRSRAVGHGAVIWDAAVVFSKYVEKNPSEFDPHKVKGKTVLELGSGCGLAGITLMLRGCEVTFTDLPEVVSAFTERNVQVSVVHGSEFSFFNTQYSRTFILSLS
jgi:predicted nicotinamide N-methyase